MILKLGMKHQAMEVYKVCVKYDPGMSIVVQNKFVSIYLRSQVSIYRTIGPLVFQTVHFVPKNMVTTLQTKVKGIK